MGRITQALKRAQEERARRAGGEPSAPSTAQVAPDTGTTSRVDMTLDVSAEPTEAMPLIPPPSPAPFVIAAPAIVPDCVGREVVALHDPASSIVERYRSVRTRLVTGNPSGGARVVAVTSSLPREGKTVTTANLGFSLAELRHLRVVMIDCDFRRRGLSGLFQALDKPGLAEVIREDRALADVCLPVVRDNLFLVPTGNARSGNPSELLAGGRAAAVFQEIGARFHYSLIDTPPANTAADIGLVAPLCHSVVIVIRMGRTPEHVLRRCVRMLQANHVAIAGAILAGYSEETMACVDPHDYYEGQR